jgi:hypothetical protein
MDQNRSGGISPTGIILIVLGCVGVGVLICAGVIVVCLVAITALGTSANATFGTVGTKIADRPDLQAKQAGTQFINDLCAGLTQSAWDQTTSDFQSRHIKVGGPDQSKYFADILQEYPGLRKPAAIDIISQITVSDQTTIEASVTPRSGERIILNLKLKKELGTWKVNDLAVLDAEAVKRKLQETAKEINKRRKQNEDAKDRK